MRGKACEDCDSTECSVAIAVGDDEPIAYSQCLERQLMNQSSLLRSVTGKLEEARELLDGQTEARNMFAAAALIDSVLEVLS
jgi:hypothetical protein